MLGNKENIIVSIGDDGAILAKFNAGKLEKRAFSQSAYSGEFQDFIKDSPNAPITVLLDTVDQNYVFSNLPSSIKKGSQIKIVKRKLENEFDKNDFNSYLNLGHEDPKGNKGIRYVFISVRNASPLIDWLEVIHELPNSFEGICLVPIESEKLLLELKKEGKKKTKNQYKEETWEILISHNRVGGFRQIVFKNGKIIFTRISQNPGINSPDAVGTNITQEASNTLEYIRRIGYTDQQLSIFIISSKDSHQFIDIPSVNQNNINFFSPYEAAQKIGIDSPTMENDKFADVVLSSHVNKSKKQVLKFTTEKAKKDQQFNLMSKLAVAALYALILAFPIISAYFFYTGYNNSSKISDLETKKRGLQASMGRIKDFEAEYGLDSKMVVDVAKADKVFNDEQAALIGFLNKYSKFDIYSKEVLSLTYKKDANNGKHTFEIKLVFEEADIDNVKDVIFKLGEFKTNLGEEFKEYSPVIKGIPEERDLSNKILADSTSKEKNKKSFKYQKGDAWKAGIPITVNFQKQ